MIPPSVAPGRSRWWRTAAMWLAHRQPLILAVAITVFFTDAVAIPMPLVCLALFPVVITSMIAEGFHHFNLCPRCAHNMPLNGPQTALERSDWLRLHHALRGVLWTVVLGAGGLTAALVWHVPTGVAYVPLYVGWIVEAVANLRHRPLGAVVPAMPPLGLERRRGRGASGATITVGRKVRMTALSHQRSEIMVYRTCG